MENERIVKKLHTALKLSGFNVRREFCLYIGQKFFECNVDLDDNHTFDTSLKNICNSLENQCIPDCSIEKEHIDVALEICLNSGYDKNETIFNVIDAFDFPKLSYNVDRKQYFKENKKSEFLSEATTKAQLWVDRYTTVLERTRRNFKQKIADNIELKLHTVDYLLTLSYASLENILILGSLLQVSEGKYHLEDPTGTVELNLSHVKYHGGFFVENLFVLVNGYYEDKLLKVSTMVLPPGEENKDSRIAFGALNYFGGPSDSVLRDSIKLREHMEKNRNDMMMFFSDVWLDHPVVFEKLETLFDGLNESPPVAFVFMGNFLSQMYDCEKIDILKRLFKQFGELINKYPNLMNHSNFVFVPGIEDPCMTHIVPRLALPSCITAEMTNVFKKAIFTTNPCRIQYCSREITIFRADILSKFLQGALYKPPKEKITESLTRTLISQGHLSPLPLNALTVHWDFDYTLRLYPLPDLVILGDKSESYEGNYKDCNVVNPGSFCETNFQFKSYVPSSNTIDSCML